MNEFSMGDLDRVIQEVMRCLSCDDEISIQRRMAMFLA